MRYLTVALAKGRLAELSMELFMSMGMDCSEMKEKTRKLIFTDEKNKMKFILVKASDVPTYVEYGAAERKMMKVKTPPPARWRETVPLRIAMPVTSYSAETKQQDFFHGRPRRDIQPADR